MCASFSLRQAPVANNLTLLLDQVEAVARAIADNSIDHADPIPAIAAANWHQQLQRIQRTINPAI